ncbi:HlyC/CorC family transporter [Nesterenkonia salmonea]|uniref:HlyC/CorC family transporter n=1 Tax=Nesterenkonia salmonea TaxID=1804987 RepID=A0A5R9BET6_9MICC|nr:hemolysin family protein [Nesterenkonia salmonea]TLP99088.1 HlyC/CorC family transporter [Nesterenkonia salmonea]
MITPLLIGAAIAAAILVFLLSTAEAAFIRLTRKEAEDIAQRDGSRSVEHILEQPVPHTLALQIWRWVLTTAAIVLMTISSVRLIGDVELGAVVAGAVLALIGVLSAAVSPRKIGRAHHLSLASATARMVRGLRISLGPIPVWLSVVGGKILPGTASDQGFFDDDELLEYIARANESDVIEDSEAELIESVLDMSTTRVRSVMVPRTDMVTIEVEADLDEAMTLFLGSGYSRMPVIRGSADDITGMVYLKDVAFLEHMLRTGRAPSVYAGRTSSSIRVEELQRDVRYVPESKSVGEFLSELQRESTHVAIVIDEYGGTAGLVTMEDLIEELVGEIVDEYDREDAEVEALEDGRLRLSARMSVDDFAEEFGLDLDDEEDVDTVGGLLAKMLGRVPIAGSEVEIDGVVLHADRLGGRRNRVTHVLAWEHEDRRGARGGVGTGDEDDATRQDSDRAPAEASR